MGLGPLIGFLLVMIGVFIGALAKGVSPVILITNVPAILIVILGSTGSTMMSFPLADTKGVIKAFIKAFKPGPPPDFAATIDTIVELSDKGRKEGLLALESELSKLEYPLLQRGLQAAVDGVDAAVIEDTLLGEIAQMKARHKVGAAWMTQAGVYAPTLGIIGAVFGLIATLGHLDDPSKLGAGISAAFVATFWGVWLAN